MWIRQWGASLHLMFADNSSWSLKLDPFSIYMGDKGCTYK